MSLRVTLLAAFTYALLAVLIALLLPLTLNISRRVDAEIKAEALGQVSLVATSAADEINRPERLRELVDRSAESLGGRLIVTDRDGLIVADSAGTGLEGADYGGRPEVSAALVGENSQGRRDSELLGEELLFTAAPVIENGRTVGAVRATQSVAAVNDAVRNDALVLVGAGGVALLLGVGVAWILAGFLTRPLESLTTAARQVAAGDLDARAPERGSREQRQVAAAFNEMTGRLQGALEAQREFVANASHQLRTPLTGLQLRLEAAGDSTNDPAIRDELRAAEDEVDRLAALLTNLLVLAREGQEPPEPEPVDLERSAKQARERWAGEADAQGARIRLEGDPGVRVMASPDDLQIMLDNLLENALRYSEGAGDVAVTWGSSGPDGFIAVCDSGPGLRTGEHERVLDRFVRGESAATSGTGLGLAIVSTLARRWAGSIELRDRDPRGLCAEITLPLPSPNPAGSSLV
jgi:two-component system, OmpR family, sensor kinase